MGTRPASAPGSAVRGATAASPGPAAAARSQARPRRRVCVGECACRGRIQWGAGAGVSLRKGLRRERAPGGVGGRTDRRRPGPWRPAPGPSGRRPRGAEARRRAAGGGGGGVCAHTLAQTHTRGPRHRHTPRAEPAGRRAHPHPRALTLTRRPRSRCPRRRSAGTGWAGGE